MAKHSTETKTIVCTGGGTGGHIYPGLAVIEELQRQYPFRVAWIGNKEGMDGTLIHNQGIEFYGIPSGKLRRYWSLQNITDMGKVLQGFFKARTILKELQPVLVFSKGGFVSVPPCAAAASLGIPVFTHESDYTPGLATKINLRFARYIFVAYEESRQFFPASVQDRIVPVGNPVRRVFYEADAEEGRRFLNIPAGERILLVLGGSQGARQVNELVWASLPQLTATYVVVHQTGGVQEGCPPAQPRYRPFPYLREELPHILAASELVVGRSGAGTVWEAATVGRPMVLIPLAGSGTRGDQVDNARFFERAGAARVLLGEAARPDMLVQEVDRLATDKELRTTMVEAAKRIGAVRASQQIAEAIFRFLKEKGS
ncbi:MAG: undecaprenyldiphospho-muramoylpentapeptide beta-N-acetylglucosaminyltransferase [Treponemataceae bacterium]|nr:undecaprenyldiphospho-muramoylpentapeptide beta-N-acetylglucosaminyltransferase [Treponemataceae bacterium]